MILSGPKPVVGLSSEHYTMAMVGQQRTGDGTTSVDGTCQGVGLSLPVVARMTSHKLTKQGRET